MRARPAPVRESTSGSALQRPASARCRSIRRERAAGQARAAGSYSAQRRDPAAELTSEVWE